MMMGEGTPVEEWFKVLPLSDPRCRNDSCIEFKTAHDASQKYVSFYHQFDYGYYVAWYYSGIISLFILAHFFHRLIDREPHPGGPSVVNKSKAAIRSVSYRRLSGPWGMYFGLPSYGILFIIILSFTGSCAMAFGERPYYRQFRGFGSPPVAVRTGLMAAALIPLIIAFGGKVNLITMLTGIGHEKLNAMHRWVGWIMFLLSTVHTIPFFYQESKDGILYMKFYKEGSYEFNGVLDYAFCFGLVASSFPFIRRKFYEAFVYFHWIFAIIFLAMSFWHFGNQIDSWTYLWFTLAIWGVQILGRIFWKTSAFKIDERWFSGLPTVATRLPGDMAKLEVFVPVEWTWRPGQHAFLRFPHLNPLDNHPFTIASIPGRIRLRGKEGCDGGNIMTFFVKAHNGATKKLLDWLEKSPEASITTIIDGPYGTVGRRYENCADEVVLVAGGNGISAMLPYLEHFQIVMQQNETVTKHVKLIWMVRNHEHIEWIAEDLQKILRNAVAGSMSIDIHVTDKALRGKGSVYESETEGKEKEGNVGVKSSSSLGVDIEGVTKHFEGRPNLLAILPAGVGSKRTAVIGCGPESLKIDLSNAVAGLQGRILRGEAVEISLHTETFDW